VVFSSKQNLKVWYKRPAILFLIALNVLTLGFLLPSLVSFLRSLRQRKLIAIANAVSLVVSIQFSSPAIFLISWLGLLVLSFLLKPETTAEKEMEIAEEKAETEVTAQPAAVPVSVWQPPQAPKPPVVEQMVAEEPRVTKLDETLPGVLWSTKAEKNKTRIEKRLAAILIENEQLCGIVSTNRVRGAVVDFICATDARLIVFYSKGSSNSSYEWACWSDIHQVHRKSTSLSENMVRCELQDGTVLPMGQLLEKASCDAFFQLAERFTTTPPNPALEQRVRETESVRASRVGASNATQNSARDNHEKQKMSFTQWVKFKWLYRKQISIAERSFVNAHAMNVGLHLAYQGFKQEVSKLDKSLFDSTSEQNILSISGCNLIEVRKGARVTHRESSYSGSSSGGSVRVGRVRVGGSSHGGSSSSTTISYPAPDELTRIDRGKFLVTNLRVSFVGGMFTKSAEFKKIADYKSNSRQILIAPRTGSKVWIVEFPTLEEAWTGCLLLETAFATPQKRLDEKSGSIYGEITKELESNFNRAVAEIELAIQDSEDELKIFRDVWGEYLSQYPGRLKVLKKEMEGEIPEYQASDSSQSLVTLKLISAPNEVLKKIEIIKTIRVGTGLSLGDAKNLVDNPPAVIASQIEADFAQALQGQLQLLGAEVEIV
jgi:ribosomal protein L7/L12